MTEHFQRQIEIAKQENKPDFKLFYFIQSGAQPSSIILEMKSLNPSELNTFDFSNLEFARININMSIPTFKYKNV